GASLPAPRGEPGCWQRGLGRYGRWTSPTKIVGAGLHALDAQRQHVTHFHGLGGVERLPVPGADQRAVVRILHLDQRVEVLSGGEDFARRLGAVELAAVTADRG